MDSPVISVIIPVFNTGPYLLEAVASVLQQRALPGVPLPPLEVVVVDDQSTDAVTLTILAQLAQQAPNVRVLRNSRAKGAAGARNTGINHALGHWIGFLDSDDIWFPYALALRWQVVLAEPDARWIAARFELLRPLASADSTAQFAQGAALLAAHSAPPAVEPVRRLERPVAAFTQECMVGIMTVLIRRDLLQAKGQFHEGLPRSEDYHLWLRCALDTDLWLVPVPIAYYRIHAASLTHGDAPRFLHEERMLQMLLQGPEWQPHALLLLRRFDMVMQDHCYFYRSRRRFERSLGYAWHWVRHRPLRLGAWKQLLASGLRIA